MGNPNSVRLIRHPVPRVGRPGRILIGIRTTNVYNSSIRICRNDGPCTGCPIILNRRNSNRIVTINRNIASLGPNTDIIFRPVACYNGYCTYHYNRRGIYHRLGILNYVISNVFRRCIIVPHDRICRCSTSGVACRRTTLYRPFAVNLRTG